MADNINITPGVGVTVSTDDIGGGVEVQRMKVQFGVDGSATDVSSGAPLPVDISKIPASAPLSDTLANPTTYLVGASNLVWNLGATQWQRIIALTGDGLASTGIPAAGTVAYNGATLDRVRTVQGAADGSNGLGELVAVQKLYNGTTYDRRRTAKTDGTAVGTTGVGASAPHRWNGSTYSPDITAGQIGDGDSGNGTGTSSSRQWNGTNYDRQRNNQTIALLTSAARTATPTVAQQINYNARGVVIVLNVTSSSGTGGLITTIQSYDPVDNTTTFPLNSNPTTITTNAVYTYAVYPGIAAGYTQTTNAVLPRLWTVLVSHQDASSYTYSVGAYLIL